MEGFTMLLNRRTFLAGSALAAASVGMGLAGCGSKGEDAAKSEGAKEITAAAAYEAPSYMPMNCSAALSLASNWHVVEGLYELNLVDFKPYKALAADEPVKISDTEYEVALRKDAKFSTGDPVTADDVVTSFKRTIEAEGALYKSMIDFIDAIEKKNDTTVTVKLTHPFSLVKERLSLVKVVPASATDEELTKMPVGSGPWKYESIDEKTIQFMPNELYNGTKPATSPSMRWDIIKDATARTTAITEGTVLVMENVPADTADQVRAAGADVESVQGFGLPFLMFNTKQAPFDDKRVRQAFFYAIDVEKLISNAMSGMAAPVTSFLPENHANYHKAATVFTYDPEKAKALLAEAGQSDLSVTLDTTDHTWIKALSPQIKNNLEAVGVKVDIVEQASSALYKNKADTGEYSVALAPGDPSVFGNDPDLLMNWWYGDNSWTQKRTMWKDSEGYTKLHKEMDAAVAAEGKAQQEAWNNCFDILADECPLYPLFHRQVATGVYGNKLDGFEPIGTTGMLFLGTTAK